MNFEKRADGRVTCPFDHHSPDYAARFAEIIDEMRLQAPLVWSSLHGGFWVATTYDLVRTLRKDSGRLKLNQVEGEMDGGLSIPVSPAARHRRRFIPGETDGEEHDRYRLALNPMFSRRKVAELQPIIDRHVVAAIDRVLEQREFDVVEDLAGPSFTGIAAEHLSFDVPQPRPFFKKFSGLTTYSAVSATDLGTVSADFQEAWSVLIQTVKDRRESPRDDVISHLVQWTDPAFTDDEIHSMVFNVILGSVDNVTNFISHVFLYMDQHREVRDLLAARPDLVPDAVDEFSARSPPPAIQDVRSWRTWPSTPQPSGPASASCSLRTRGTTIRPGTQTPMPLICSERGSSNTCPSGSASTSALAPGWPGPSRRPPSPRCSPVYRTTESTSTAHSRQLLGRRRTHG